VIDGPEKEIESFAKVAYLIFYGRPRDYDWEDEDLIIGPPFHAPALNGDNGGDGEDKSVPNPRSVSTPQKRRAGSFHEGDRSWKKKRRV
jgi:hypothetical protein